MGSLHTHPASRSAGHLPLYVRVAWVLLLVLGLFPILAALTLPASVTQGLSPPAL